MHYYQFNIGDYASHTRHLTVIEDIAYRRLLDAYYLQERPFNANVSSVARQINMREHEPDVKTILEEFFILCEDGWRNERADKEIDKFHDKSKKASDAGKASAEQRKNKRSTDVEQTFNQPITINQEPITKNQEPIKKSMSEYSDEFISFWKSYPKKTGKGEAFKSWKKQRPSITDVLKALEWQRTSQDWIKDNGQYVPNPATYLNQRRWEDEPKGRVKMTTEEFMRSQL